MSEKGIKMVASIFSQMQTTRHELLKIGIEDGKTDYQDIRLAQLLETGKEAMKDKFVQLTIEPRVKEE